MAETEEREEEGRKRRNKQQRNQQMAETDIQINKGVRGRMKDKEEAREE